VVSVLDETLRPAAIEATSVPCPYGSWNVDVALLI
jgi:hypothetical protein